MPPHTAAATNGSRAGVQGGARIPLPKMLICRSVVLVASALARAEQPSSPDQWPLFEHTG